MSDHTKKLALAASQLRSSRWLANDDLRSFGHRSRLMQMGYDPTDWEDKPIIAIINTWSDLNPCHLHFRHRIADIKRGVQQAGGLAFELPVLSLSESFMRPSTMLYRNLLAMEVEEQLRAYPIDGAILMGGCDKTTPALIMGGISSGLPYIFFPAGPMLRGNFEGEVLGSGSDAWKFWDERRAGGVSDRQWLGIQGGIARSYGHCMTMGTASTMTAIVDAMGLTIPGASSIPAADANHIRMATECGRRIVDLVWNGTCPHVFLTRKSFHNATVTAMAMGCSTNAVIHVLAMARRASVNWTLDDFDTVSRKTPIIANIRPSGERYLMEDFYYAGGVLGLMSELKEQLYLDTPTISGEILGDILAEAKVFNYDVIRSTINAIYKEGSIAILKGNLAPNGAVIKPAACDPKFYRHQGPALVFDNYLEMKEAIEDETLEVTPDHVLILRNAGPIGGPGMPEWGMLPIPKALIDQGHRDMLRISDARMSGTSYGACVLHVAPEAFVGGPLALVKTGDIIRLDIEKRQLDMLVSPDVLQKRRDQWIKPQPNFGRGYGWMYARHVGQADIGCDFDYMETGFGFPTGEPDIF